MELERKKIQRALYFVVYALLPVGIFYLMEAYEHNALLEVRTEAQFFNIFIFELLAWIIYLAIGHMCAAADRKSTRLNFSHYQQSRMPSSA